MFEIQLWYGDCQILTMSYNASRCSLNNLFVMRSSIFLGTYSIFYVYLCESCWRLLYHLIIETSEHLEFLNGLLIFLKICYQYHWLLYPHKGNVFCSFEIVTMLYLEFFIRALYALNLMNFTDVFNCTNIFNRNIFSKIK